MRVGSRRGRLAVIATIGAATLVLAGCSDSSSSGGDGGGTDLSKSTTDLGTKKAATGSPVKVGVVSEEAPDSDARATGVRIAAAYANDYLGGLNGHKIELDECATNATPAGGTACGVQFGKDGVVAVIDSNDGQSLSTFKGLDGAAPFFTQLSADTDVLTSDDAFVMFNPLGLGTATIAIAKAKGVDNAAFVMPDLPSTTGPVKALAGPQYDAAGLKYQIVAIPTQTADPTAQIQQAINNGAGQLIFFGTTEFVVTGIKVAKQLGFTGPLITQVTGFPADQVASIPGGLDGVITLGSASQDATSADRKLYNTVLKTYGGGMPTDNNFTTAGYQTLLSLVDGVALTPAAGGDAASVQDAMAHMPQPVPLRLGGGITFQCGVGKVSVLAAACVGETLESDLDAKGDATSEKVLTAADAG